MIGSVWQTKPPPGTPINWRHPLAGGLVVAVPLNEGGSSAPSNAVNGQSFALNTGGVWTQPTPWGAGLYGSGDASTAKTNLVNPLATGPFTLTACFQFGSTSTACVFGGAANYLGIWINYPGANTIAVLCNNSAYYVSWTDAANFVAGRWLVATMAFASASTINIPTTLTVNGLAYSTQTSPSASGIPSPAYMCIGGLSVGSHPLKTPVGGVFVHNRALGLQDACAFSANPWQIFAPPPFNWLLHPAASGNAYSLSGATGSYSETGIGSILQSGRHLIATLGGYTESGLGSSPVHGRHLVGATGAYTESGLGASPVHGYHLTAAVSSYTETGGGATLTWTHAGVYTLAAATGGYTEAGLGATLQTGRHLLAAAGTYTETGQGAILQHGRYLACATAAYLETGDGATLRTARHLLAATGSYTETGESATLVWIAGGTPKALWLPYDFTTVLLAAAGDADPFGIDPGQTAILSSAEDLDPFDIDPGQTAILSSAEDLDPFDIDPGQTTLIITGLDTGP